MKYWEAYMKTLNKHSVEARKSNQMIDAELMDLVAYFIEKNKADGMLALHWFCSAYFANLIDSRENVLMAELEDEYD